MRLPITMQLTSPAFREGGVIPRRYTHEGRDMSPPLRWSPAPRRAKTLAIICDDPDADAATGEWIHWLLYNLPARIRRLPEHLPGRGCLPGGARQGVNDFKRVGYSGPCLPPGEAHRYRFRLYALDAILRLNPRATKARLFSAMKGHVIGEASMVVLYLHKRKSTKLTWEWRESIRYRRHGCEPLVDPPPARRRLGIASQATRAVRQGPRRNSAKSD